MATFILVHGMFHGGWSFDRIRGPLEAAGHRVIAPDLHGCGGDSTPAAKVTLAGWAEAVAELIRAAPEPVVLVGHSRGGLVISQAAELASDNIAVLVYLTALLIPDGKSPLNMGEIMAEAGEAMPADAATQLMPRRSEDGMSMLVPDNAAEVIYADVAAADRDWAVPQMTSEPVMPLATPLSVSAAKWGSVPKVYIRTLRDRTLATASQTAMIKVTPPDEVIDLDADHMPTFTHVDELVGMLTDIAARYGSR